MATYVQFLTSTWRLLLLEMCSYVDLMDVLHALKYRCSSSVQEARGYQSRKLSRGVIGIHTEDVLKTEWL